ncbi:MAG: serine--tRNA ligase [Bacteroidota bacterium]
MLDIKLIRQDPERVRQGLKRRGMDLPIDDLIAADTRLREGQAEADRLRQERNTISEEIARDKKQGKDASEKIASMKAVAARIKELEAITSEAEATRTEIMERIPNLVDDSVPDGLTEDENVEVLRWGTPRSFGFDPKAHWEIGESLGIIDFERAAKLAGARFVLMRGYGARLERALINYMLEMHREAGFIEVLPPFVASEETLYANGNLPKFADQLFHLEGTKYYMIPTAEVPLTNIYRGEIIEESALPYYFTAYTPCFRSEAGAAGKDTRGMIRVHQFNKVEMVKVVKPETSFDELESMTAEAEKVLQGLGLPYRKILLCAGDTGFNAAKTYDLEVWFPAQDKYREISSCSNCTDFQARRGMTRMRTEKGILNPHTLNGSGLAVGRTVAAILENYQEEDGSVTVPEALRPYLGTDRIKGEA